jgi:hypothetical protein
MKERQTLDGGSDMEENTHRKKMFAALKRRDEGR